MSFARLLLTFLLAMLVSIASAQTASNAKKQEAQNTADVPESWLSQVKKDIRQREYRIAKKTDANTWQSFNRAQNLRITYHPDKVEMKPKKDSTNDKNWHLSLQTLGLYADDEQIQGTKKDASVQIKDSMADFRHGPVTIQYLNTKKGLRQNFIVEELEDKPETLEVKLQSKGLKVRQGGKAELQFYKEGGKKQLTYNDLKVWDANGKTLPARFETEGQNIHIRVKAGNAKYPITIDPLSTTADWVAKGNQESAWFGFNVSNAGDLNGDGYDDVIIGAHLFDNGQVDEGLALVYHGSNQGLSQTPDWTAEGNQDGAYFGGSVSAAGDVNKDGYGDVIIGAHLFDNGQVDEGRAVVYHGSDQGLSEAPDWMAKGDQREAYFGSCVSTTGDINGDGFDDVIIGAYGYDNGRQSKGQAVVYHGSDQGLSTTADWIAKGDQESARFGFNVSYAGDVNGDCGDDIIIGAPRYNNGQSGEGKVFVFHGDYAGQPAPISDSIISKKWPTSPAKDSFATYTIKSIERADTIKWTFPENWIVQNRQGDTSIQVKVGNAGEICIIPANDCGEADTCIKVEPVNPNISDTTACEDDTVKIGPSLPTAQSIEWNTGDTTEQILIDTSGTYSYEAVMEDSTIYRDTAQVTIAPRPHVYVGPDKAFCGQVDYRINPDVKGGNKYQWNTGDTTKTLYVDEGGRYWLRVESEESCSNADTTEIQEVSYPNEFDTNQIEVCRVSVKLDAGNPGANHIWNTGDTTRKITVDEDGQYIVSIANAYCSIRDTVEVVVNEESVCPYLWMPNAFSPDGDGLNDVLKPDAQKIQDYEMTVYNRWGQKVFQSKAVDKGWDGTVEGEKAPVASYLYQVTYKVREDGILQWKSRKGLVELMR